MTPDQKGLTASNLLDLYKHIFNAGITYLDLCHKYLSFFTGLLSTVIGGMVVGIWSLGKKDERALVLLFAPVAIALLSIFGYRTIRVFYRRFAEARLTSQNLEIMLGLTAPVVNQSGGSELVLRSRHGGGFLTRFERPEIRVILETAQSSEEALERILKCADTLEYAKGLFIGFVLAALVLGGFGLTRSFWR